MTTSNFTRLLLVASLTHAWACGDDSADDGASNDSTAGEGTADDVDSGDETPDDGMTDDGMTDGVDESTGGEAMGEIRVLHLGVNAPGVDIFANGAGPVVSDLQFGTSTAYVPVPTGTSTFEVTVSGSPVEDAVLAPEVTIEADTKYTAVAIGDLNEMGDTGLQAIALVDDDAGIDAANVRITVIHAAPAVGEVDIWEISDPANPVALLEDVPFAASATLPDIPAGPVEIGIDIDNDAVPDVTFSVDASAAAGLQVNAFASNDDNGDVALILQLPGDAVLRVDPN